MITSLTDRLLRFYELHTSSPTLPQKAAKLLRSVLVHGLKADRLEALQLLRLQQTLRYVSDNSPFYQQQFRQSGLQPEDIRTLDHLRRLPFTEPADVQEWQQFLCVPREKCAALFTSAGTTGEPKQIYFTYGDLQTMTNLAATAMRANFSGPLVSLIALPMRHGLWIGWNSACRAIERAGGMALPVGAEDPDTTMTWMKRTEPTVVFSSPSHMTTLTTRAEAQGFHMPLQRILLGGETLFDEQAERFASYWGAEIYDSYGAVEIGGAQTIALPDCCGFHLNDLHLITEILDPQTGEPADEGELVFTTLTRQAMPLIRYRLGDLAQWTDCDCWLPFSTIELGGRADDMFVAGDLNLYGRVIADAITRVEGAKGRVELRIDKVDLTDRLVVRVAGSAVEEEAVRQALYDAYPQVAREVQNENLLLAIETDVDLEDQIKAVKIVDERRE